MNTLRQNRLSMNQLPHFITRSVDHFLFLVFFGKKLYLISFFVHYIVIQLIDFYWNYFLYNFSLLDGLLRLVFLLMIHSYFIMTVDQWTVGILPSYILWWIIFFKKNFYIASHGAPISCLLWTSFLFLQTLFYLSTQFLSTLILESSVIYYILAG